MNLEALHRYVLAVIGLFAVVVYIALVFYGLPGADLTNAKE